MNTWRLTMNVYVKGKKVREENARLQAETERLANFEASRIITKRNLISFEETYEINDISMIS